MATRNRTASAGEIMPGINLNLIHKSASAIVPVTTFTTLVGWDKLNADEQNVVRAAGTGLAQAMLAAGYSQLAIGAHLSKAQTILEPHNMFGRFLKNFHFSKSTAYRYIRKYENASNKLPQAIVQAAMTRGIEIAGTSDTAPLGQYTRAAAKLPPPTAPNVEQANTWLDQVEQVRKESRTNGSGGPTLSTTLGLGVPEDPGTALKVCYRFINVQFSKLPNNNRTRDKWKKQLIGLLMTKLGVNAGDVAPLAIPADFDAQRGRPRVAAA